MTIPRGQSPSTSQALDANTKILRRRFPRLATFIESYAEQPPGTVCAQATRSGLPTISVESGTATVHAHSTFQPVVEVQR